MRLSMLVWFLWIGRQEIAHASADPIPERENISESEHQSSGSSTQQSQEARRAHASWLPRDFPNPFSVSASCRNGRICDPDLVLTPTEMDSVVMLMQDFEKTQSIPCRLAGAADGHGRSSSDVSSIPVQLAVGLVNNMDLSSFVGLDDREMKAAEFFCRSLHDKWGVGHNVPSCGGGTGIFIFVSALDRALYISRGGALDNILSDARLNNVIDQHMKPWFRQHQYGNGLKAAIHQIRVYLERGPPSWQEKFGTFCENYGADVILILFAGLFGYASQLSELDRARAEALQGQYHATSCPICLEDFKVKPTTSPIDRTDRESTVPLTAEKHDHYDRALSGNSDTTNLVGSDGLPLKLLGCGHVFDETCWAEWVTKGSSVTRCPICQQDVGGNQCDGIGNHATGLTSADNDINFDQLIEQRHERALRQYQRERYFRLLRLNSRYPQYVRPQQIQIWSQSTYDGCLARDPTFVKSDPKLQTSSGNHSSGSGSSCSGGTSFGGGMSSGGRGGRW